MPFHEGPPGEPWHRPSSSTVPQPSGTLRIGARARRRAKLPIAKPTRHRSTILGMLLAVWIELAVMVVGWMILRSLGWA